VASLSQATAEKNLKVQVASEMFCSLNLKKAKEAWVTVNIVERMDQEQPANLARASGK